jgi:ADP-ribose pyrophosphatase YjhB (NUDIX family)
VATEDDELAAAAVAAWWADRGDRVPLSAEAPIAVADHDTAAVLSAASVPAVADPPLARARDTAVTTHPALAAGGPHAAAALTPGDVAAAGAHLEALVAGAAARVSEEGLVVIAAAGRFVGAGRAGGVDAMALARAVGHAGLAVVDRLAPGAANRLAGGSGRIDTATDRTPGLLDAAPVTMCVGRRTATPAERERAFFASVPRKIVAAAALCRDPTGRLLCVHDAFKQRWTIPGGVVDADERPDAAARREAAEEAGVDVELGALLGVFAAAWPDRLTFVYAAAARGEIDGPGHAHEIDAVAWMPLETAQHRLVAYVAEQVQRCLAQPGGTWRQPTA